jgi:hypothetical protein
MTWLDDLTPANGINGINGMKNEFNYSIVQYESLVKESFLYG